MPPPRRRLIVRVVPRLSFAQQPDGLVRLEVREDERSVEARPEDRAAIRVNGRDPDHERVIHAGQEVHAQACGRRGVRAVRDAVAQVAGDPHGLAADHDQAVVERIAVHGDAVQSLADLERDDLPDILERRPPAAVLQLQPTAAQDERALVLVLERLGRVDAPQHADVPRGPLAGERDRAAHGHDPGGRDDPADAGAGSHAAQQPPRGDDRQHAADDEEEGDHGSMIAHRGRTAGGGARGESAARRNLLDAWTLR